MQLPHRQPTQPDSWREALQFINKCPICSGVYKAANAELCAKNDSASLVHITCERCSSYFMAMILQMGQGLSSVGMITDLSFADTKRLYQATPISVNDMISGYQDMQETTFFNALILNETGV